MSTVHGVFKYNNQNFKQKLD